MLEYIKSFETIKEQILDLKEVEGERQQYEVRLQDIYEPQMRGSQIDTMVNTIEHLQSEEE